MSDPDEFVSLKALSERLGMDRSHARKYVLKLGFHPHRRRTADSANQLALCVTAEEASAILSRRAQDGFLGSSSPVVADVGVFYVIQVIPELDPGRVKLGFATDLADRLAQHRTAAPTATVLKAWPCRRTWEQTAIDCLSAVGCRLLLNEVFECADLAGLQQRGESFFALLPDPRAKLGLSEKSPLRTPGSPGDA